YVLRRRYVKDALIQIERSGIEVTKLAALFCAATGRVVVQGAAKDPAAKVVPVALRVDEMQMPGLIDRIGRRNLATCRQREVAEFLVFRNYPDGIVRRPAVLAGQTMRK